MNYAYFSELLQMLPSPKPEVVLFGGTHGNELTGIQLIQHWQDARSRVTRAHFETKILLSNPAAAKVCRRYVDHDLNRCFLPADLSGQTKGYEFDRAREIVKELGGSRDIEGKILIDLHTTTSQMGPTVILTSVNPFNLQLCARLQQRLPELRIITNELKREDSPFVNGLSPYGFCIEVGPVAQGALNPTVVQQTKNLVVTLLDLLGDFFSTGSWTTDAASLEQELEVFEYSETVDYPRRPDGSLAAMIHHERYGYDFIPIERGSPLFVDFDGHVITFDEHVTVNERDGIFWPIFVGESAYVEKQTAMVLTRKKRLHL
jgi:aspartoacylase